MLFRLIFTLTNWTISVSFLFTEAPTLVLDDAVRKLYGAQDMVIQNSVFQQTKKISMHLVVGEPIVKVDQLHMGARIPLEVTGNQKYSIGKIYRSSIINNLPLGSDNQTLGIPF